MNSDAFSAPPLPLQSQLEASVSQWMADHPLLPGAIVGVWKDGYQPWRASFGVSDLETQAPLRLDDHVRIGSNTKTFTGTVVLQLVDEGKLSLDDKVVKYIPEIDQLLNGKGDEITIRELGTHTSGIFNYSANPTFAQQFSEDPFRTWTPEELVGFALQSEPYFDPGQGFVYANTNTVLLGLIVQEITGNSIASEIQHRILDPLGMTETSFPTTSAIPKPYAHGYQFADPSDTNPTDVSDWSPSWAWAAGQMISTLDDLYRYAKPLATGQLLSPEMQAERLQWVPASEPFFSEEVEPFLPPGTTVDYRYGFQIMYLDGGIGHAGSVPGYNTFFSYISEQDATVVVLTTAQQVPDSQKGQLISPVYPIAQLIYDQLNQIPPSDPCTIEVHPLPPTASADKPPSEIAKDYASFGCGDKE